MLLTTSELEGQQSGVRRNLIVPRFEPVRVRACPCDG